MLISMPEGDYWEIEDTNPKSASYRKIFHLNYTPIDNPSIKNVVKHYVWFKYKRGELVPNSLKATVRSMHLFSRFAQEFNIRSLKEIGGREVALYKTWLSTVTLLNNGKPFGSSWQRNCYGFLRSIITWGQNYLSDEVPKGKIFPGNEYIGASRRLHIDFIPDEIVEKINAELPNEKNVYTRNCIIILEETGMRINDLEKLNADCIGKHPISGGDVITFYDHKNQKERVLPCRARLVNAINEIKEFTSSLREDDSFPKEFKNYLLIHSPNYNSGYNNSVSYNYCTQSINAFFRKFIREHNIVDSNGELYAISSHQFRRTLGTDMLSKGHDPKVISEVLGIDIRNVKKFYAKVKDAEMARVFRKIGIIGDINKVDKSYIPNEQELESFKRNKEKGFRMMDGYCTKPIEKGPCAKIGNRLKCLRCVRFITTPEFLDVLKVYLTDLKSQLEHNIYGEHWASHVRPTVEVLSQIVVELEALRDGETDTSQSNT